MLGAWRCRQDSLGQSTDGSSVVLVAQGSFASLISKGMHAFGFDGSAVVGFAVVVAVGATVAIGFGDFVAAVVAEPGVVGVVAALVVAAAAAVEPVEPVEPVVAEPHLGSALVDPQLYPALFVSPVETCTMSSQKHNHTCSFLS